MLERKKFTNMYAGAKVLRDLKRLRNAGIERLFAVSGHWLNFLFQYRDRGHLQTFGLAISIQRLSKENCLARFVKLFDTIVNFLENLNEDNYAKQIKFHKCAIFFQAWNFCKFNEVSLQLQGKLCTLLHYKCVFKVFAEKLQWFRINIQKKNFEDMPELTEVSEQLSGQTRKTYEEYLIKLRENLNSRLVKILLHFPTSYLVECGFSAVNKILTKERNKIDICIRVDIRLKLTNFKPNVEGLVAKHQSQGSH